MTPAYVDLDNRGMGDLMMVPSPALGRLASSRKGGKDVKHGLNRWTLVILSFSMEEGTFYRAYSCDRA